jgi:hypothetical protein
MVIFAGARPADIAKEKDKYVLVRRDVLRDLSDHLTNHSEVYAKFRGKLNESLLTALTDSSYNEDVIVEVDADSPLLHETVRVSDRANNGSIQVETHEDIVSGLIMLDDREHGTEHDRPVTLPAPAHVPEGVLSPQIPSVNDSLTPLSQPPPANSAPEPPGLIRVTTKTTTIMSHKDIGYYPSSQPHLFPYGIGCPNGHRETKCSWSEALCHLLRKKDERQFAYDNIFCFDAFDSLARKMAMISLFIRLKSNPSISTAAVSVSEEDMQRLIKHNIEKAKCQKIGKDFPALPPELTKANQVMKCLESAAHYTYGTKEERQVMTDIVSGYIHVSETF